MTIEEVIAIAKTLRPDFYEIRTYQIWNEGRDYPSIPRFEIHWDGTFALGKSWEEALRNAGWKGKLPEDKCGGDGTYPTVT